MRLASLLKRRGVPGGMKRVSRRDQPIAIWMGHLSGITNRRQAASYCRSQIEEFLSMSDECAFFMMEREGILYFEIHEGGSQGAYLPSIFDLVDAGHREIVVETGRRSISVSVKEEGVVFTTLPESDKPSGTPGVKPGPKLTPYISERRDYLFMGWAIPAIGAIALLAAFAATQAIPKTVFVVQSDGAMSSLYTLINDIQTIKQREAGQYVSKVTFDGHRWRYELDSIASPTVAGVEALPTDLMKMLNAEGMPPQERPSGDGAMNRGVNIHEQ